jgi:hypothetical protein
METAVITGSALRGRTTLMAADRDEREPDRLEHGPWTPGERRVLAVVARDRGWHFARQHAALILAQARSIHGKDLEVVP